jgi:hypothetical protein
MVGVDRVVVMRSSQKSFSPQRHRDTENTLKDNSLDSTRQYWCVEVDEQADVFTGNSQVSEELGFVNWKKPFNRLQLENHLLCDH